MDVNPQSITLISATMAMVASIASPFVSTRVASLQFKTNVLSVNWQKWIETLRDLVFSLNSQLLAAAVRQFIEGHRQLNGLRQVGPSWTVSSEANGDASYLGPDPEGSGAGPAVINSVGVGRTEEEVGNLVVNREEALGLAG